ncbi:RluA family pseudouridine synthase [Sporosarcina pasteurii]|uniref:RNA pseudouridylate synthase n=1 Tax=Sporosarcina pasteurii TaxID=1474 RepID=A0A380CBJ6_SPOPA|nr:RluA family pseudouridine synthase [Sporosarcina pasteurii]MDS9473092.1 RluA family pseudouridine synthase [Sporosarcina pasteurii]QBQ04258.1 RluA family pseudouridine synthase [Sporosarcina pasteurii]SUJ17055.1 Ribosomal large subunit pseudouridine synthase C [Sporosarcina pasteurii]
MKINILYEDNHLLVVEKPVNIPVQEDASRDRDLLTILKEDIKVRYNKPGNVYLALVHRLDRPVGGVMVFAKTSKAASRLSDVIRRNQLERRYLAVVRGTPKKEKAKLEHFLYKDTSRNIVRSVPENYKGAKKAVLEYELLGSREGLSLLAVKLHTGRSHQIRVQLSTIGHPLFGDQKYGQQQNQKGQQIALWANLLEFPHPTTKELVSVQSPPPSEYPWNLW